MDSGIKMYLERVVIKSGLKVCAKIKIMIKQPGIHIKIITKLFLFFFAAKDWDGIGFGIGTKKSWGDWAVWVWGD